MQPTKVKPWPNGLGWDIGSAEIWRLGAEQSVGLEPEEGTYAYGVRTARKGAPHRCLRARLASPEPTDAELRCLVARCRAHGRLIED
jgi:hypothetical protein